MTDAADIGVPAQAARKAVNSSTVFVDSKKFLRHSGSAISVHASSRVTQLCQAAILPNSLPFSRDLDGLQCAYTRGL